MNKPTFFISSTIFDFRDLRSAIKFYLEEQGCTVLASEFNDFPKALNHHSYQACLETIEQADYFVLLVGARVGGWYDEKQRISITQQEYRTAYDLQKAGKLKLLSFVRSDMWQLKEDRKELANYLSAIDIPTSIKSDIATHPTKVAEDAKFIGDFLKEIGKNRETGQATRGDQDFPIGNWIHVFSEFRDVINVLRTQVFNGKPAEDAINRKLLKRELEEVLSQLLVKKSSPPSLTTPTAAVFKFVEKYKGNISPSLAGAVVIERRDWNILAIYVIHLMGARLHAPILSKILESPTFLKFELSSDSYKEEPVYEALWLLSQEIKVFSLTTPTDILRIFSAHSKESQTAPVRVTAAELMQILHFLSKASNIILLASRCASYLGGKEFSMPVLHPDNPIDQHQEELNAEKITREDVQKFLEGV